MGQPDVFVCPNLNVGPFNSYVEKEGVTLPKPKRDIIEKSMEGIDVVHIMQPLLLGPKAASIAYEKISPLQPDFIPKQKMSQLNSN